MSWLRRLRVIECLIVLVVIAAVVWAVPCWAQQAAPTAPSPPAPAPAAAPVPAPTAAPPPTPASAPEAPEIALPPLPADAQAVVAAGRPLSLKETVALAVKNQPQLAIASAGLETARGRKRQAMSAYYPTLSMSTQRTTTGPAQGGGGAVGATFTATGYTANLIGRELVYDFGKTPAAVGQASSQLESAAQALEQQRQDIVNQVKQAYYTVLENQQLVQVRRQNVANQRAHLDLAQARYDVGLAPHADVVRAETAVAEAMLNLVTAQSALAVSRATLNSAIGIDARTAIVVQETEEQLPALPEASALVEQALARRPKVKQQRAAVVAAEDTVRLTRTNNRPSVFVSGNYGLSGPNFPPDTERWSYTLGLSWPFFDVGNTRGGIAAAQGNLDAARAQLRQTELSVGSEVVQAYLDVQTAGQQLTASQSEVKSAQESLDVATGRYQAGLAVYIEVLDAETALLTAKTNLVNARYGQSIARAALVRALGLEG